MSPTTLKWTARGILGTLAAFGLAVLAIFAMDAFIVIASIIGFIVGCVAIAVLIILAIDGKL